MFTNSHRGRGHGAALAALAVAAGLLASPPPAAHAVLVPQGGGPGSTGSAPPCPTKAPATWTTPPHVLIHTKVLTDEGASQDRIDRLVTQAQAAVDQLNDIGASSLKIGSVSTTNEDFDWESTSFGYGGPAIHVGFVSRDKITADAGTSADGYTSSIYISACNPTATIEFPDIDAKQWSFRAPSDIGVPYYDAGESAPDDSIAPGSWFRASFEHEMEHAVGLSHTSTAYAMMNHRGDGGFPWTHDSGGDVVRPLPDDVRRLRDLYPGTGARWDVDTTNTWYDVTSDSKGNAADQVQLCTPTGDGWAGPDTTSGPCGGSTAATCLHPGDWLYTRYALNNYSTGSVHVTTSLALSKDETYSGDDALSTSQRTDDLDATTSILRDAKWKVPDAEGTVLHPIVHVFSEHFNADGSGDPASLHIASIPLRGTIRVTTFCPSLAHTAIP